MSFLTIAAPAASIARPLLGLGLIGALIMIFQPLLVGLLRAALLLVMPRPSRAERKASKTLRSMLTLNRMAREYEDSDPSLAAEFRALAARG
ncbi:MAG TPA: hypothetical protein VEC06_03525 [Paucimonas sp.]|nr:hypothetical protein [Paucimonas sp.]